MGETRGPVARMSDGAEKARPVGVSTPFPRRSPTGERGRWYPKVSEPSQYRAKSRKVVKQEEKKSCR